MMMITTIVRHVLGLFTEYGMEDVYAELFGIYIYTLVGAEYCSFRVSALLLFEPKPICALPFPEWFNFQGSSFLHTTPELNERLVALGTGMQEEINILGMKNAKF